MGSASARSWSSPPRGQEEPGQDDRPGLQAAVQDQDLQAADRGGRGDRRPQPCQVQEVPAGAGGGGGACQARCSSLNLRKPTQPQNCLVEFGKKSGPFCKPLESEQPCRYKSCQSAKSRTPIDVSHFPSGGALWFIFNVCRHQLVSKFLYPQIE